MIRESISVSFGTFIETNGGHPTCIVFETHEDGYAEAQFVTIQEGQELIHLMGGTIGASDVKRVADRWSEERIIGALRRGIEFDLPNSTAVSKQEILERNIDEMCEYYPKPPVELK